MRLIPSLLLLALIALFVGIVSASDETPVSGVLNPDFASQIGTVTTLNQDGEEGVFVITPNGDTALAMLKSEIVSISNEALGGFLTVYDETGQALFELPDGRYQMQLTTSNGTINLSYLNQYSNLETAELIAIDEDVLLQTSADESYQLFLMTTGELSVVISTDDGMVYRLTFTGIPALNIKQEIFAD